MSGTNIGDQLNAARRVLGLVPGRLPADDHVLRRRADRHRQRRPADLDLHPGRVQQRPGSTRPCRTRPTRGSATRCTPVGAGLSAPLTTGTGQYGYKDDYIPHHEPFQYYASTANPHHLTLPTNSSGQDTLNGAAPDRHRHPALRARASRSSTRRTTSTTRATSTSSSRRSARATCRRRRCPRSASSRRPATRTGTPAYSDPLDEQRFVVERDQRAAEDAGLEDHRGRSSPTTTPTAGTTTPTRGVTNPSAVGRRRADRPRRVRQRHPAGRRAGPLRLRAAAAAARHLAVGEAELRRPHADRPDLDHQVRRGQLGPATHTRQLRQGRRQHQRHVQLQGARHRVSAERQAVHPQPGHRGTG